MTQWDEFHQNICRCLPSRLEVLSRFVSMRADSV